MPNEPSEKTPKQSLAPRSEEAIMLRPETSLVPAAEAAPVKRYTARWFGEAWGELMAWLKLERSFSGITGIIMLVLSMVLLAVNGVTWMSVLPVVVSLSVLFVAFIILFFRAPSKLEDKKQLEIDGLNVRIKELKAEVQAVWDNHWKEQDKLADSFREDIAALTAERDSLKSQLEELKKHKLIFEIDARASQFFLQERPDKRVVVLAGIRLHFVNKDVHPWSMMSLDLSLHDLQEGVDIFTLWSARYSSNGVEIEREQFEGMLVQAGRTTPFYLFEPIMIIHDDRIQTASDLLKGLHCLRLTMEANNNQPPLTANLLLSWEEAMKEEGAYLTIVLGAPSIGRVNQRLD